MVKRRTCVFISGKGSNLKNLIGRSRDYNFPISLKLVVCNKRKALGILYAKKNSIPYLVVNTKKLSLGSSITFNKAFNEFIFKSSAPSISIIFLHPFANFYDAFKAITPPIEFPISTTGF